MVVRLKGGDPLVFGRGGEEAAALARAQIPFEIVPGVTAAVAASAYAGISLTHRDHASAVAFVTGHEDPQKPLSSLDYSALAAFPGTLVFYMGLGRVRETSQALVRAGRAPETPAAVVSRATLPGERVIVGTLADIAQRAEASAVEPPALLVVGEVLAHRVESPKVAAAPSPGRALSGS